MGVDKGNIHMVEAWVDTLEEGSPHREEGTGSGVGVAGRDIQPVVLTAAPLPPT